MCFDAGKAAGWTQRPAEAGGEVRVDHIGFGVVCGDDGKRFKTRFENTLNLIYLNNFELQHSFSMIIHKNHFHFYD